MVRRATDVALQVRFRHGGQNRGERSTFSSGGCGARCPCPASSRPTPERAVGHGRVRRRVRAPSWSDRAAPLVEPWSVHGLRAPTGDGPVGKRVFDVVVAGHAAPVVCAADPRGGPPHQARLPRAGVLPHGAGRAPGASRCTWSSSARCGTTPRPGAHAERRLALHPPRQVAREDEDRRDPPALERPQGRDEPRGPASRRTTPSWPGASRTTARS